MKGNKSSNYFESIVVGSGPGGAVTAATLAESGEEVLILEEGQNYQLDSCAPFSTKEMQQKYRCGGVTVALGNPKIVYAEGCCVGGGSEINSGLYHRLPEDIGRQWERKYRIQDFSMNELNSHLKYCEKALNVSLMPGNIPEASLKLKKGADRLNWKCLEVPRVYRYHSGAQGEKQSMSRTFLPKAINHGAKLADKTKLITIKNKKSQWILNAVKDKKKVIYCCKNLFLCCGAIQTPTILLRSGIKKNIGKNLQMHPTLKYTTKFNSNVNHKNMGVPVHQVKEFSPRLSFGCSISSIPYLEMSMLEYPGFENYVERNWRQMAIYYSMIKPITSGRIDVLPYFKDPLVRYRMGQSDILNLIDGLKKLGALLFEAGAEVLFPSISRCAPVYKKSELGKLSSMGNNKLLNTMTIHVFSSIPMGEDKDVCGADSFGKIFEQENLFVNDGSLLCEAPGVNPQGTIMAIARRNSLKFISENIA